jgi:hypothetical protein
VNFVVTDFDLSMADYIEDVINRAIVDDGITEELIEARLCFLATEEMRLHREIYRCKRANSEPPSDLENALCELDVEAMNLYRYLDQAKRAHWSVAKKKNDEPTFHPLPLQIMEAMPFIVVQEPLPEPTTPPPLPGLITPAPDEPVPIPEPEPAPVPPASPRGSIVRTETELIMTVPSTKKKNGESILKPPPKVSKSKRQEDVARFIARNGPTTTIELVKQLGIPQGSIMEVLDSPWFERHGGKVEITNEARQTVLVKEDS